MSNRSARPHPGVPNCLSLALFLLAGSAPSIAQPPAASELHREPAAALRVNLSHLNWLRRELPGPGGTPLSTWQIYATPARPHDFSGPYRYADAPGEGAGCVDDVARAAIVYLEHYEATGNLASLRAGRAALEFVRALAAGDGTYYNFLREDGSINKAGVTSHRGLTWWTARAFWATAVGARVFARVEPGLARELQADAARTTAALERALRGRDGRYSQRGSLAMPGWFAGGAPDVTAVFVIGLAALQELHPRPPLRHLIERYAAAIAVYTAGDRTRFPFNAHLPSDMPSIWHAYGAHMLHALALAGRLLDSPSLIGQARLEADNFTVHLLLSGGPIAGFLPARTPFPQIAYGVEPQVLGLLELHRVTGDIRYARMAGIMASWLTGNNCAGIRMYDPGTGRCRDGLDQSGASDNSGAESTLEALLTVQALRSDPEAADWAMARDYPRAPPDGDLGSSNPLLVRRFVLPRGRKGLLARNASGSRLPLRTWEGCTVTMEPWSSLLLVRPLR